MPETQHVKNVRDLQKMQELEFNDPLQGLIRNYEFTHRLKDSYERDILPVPELHVTENGHTIEFTGSDLACMVSMFMDGLKL